MAVFLVERPAGRAWVPGVGSREQPFWDEHAAFMDDLFERGRIVLGGPLVGGSGGLLVMEAGDAAEVGELLAGDPWIAHDVMRVGEIRAWELFLDQRRRDE